MDGQEVAQPYEVFAIGDPGHARGGPEDPRRRGRHPRRPRRDDGQRRAAQRGAGAGAGAALRPSSRPDPRSRGPLRSGPWIFLEDLRYTQEHEWVRVDGTIARVGITDYAQDALGDVVYVDLPTVGATVAAMASCCEVESTKSVSEIFSPVVRHDRRGERRPVRRAADDQRGSVRQGLDLRGRVGRPGRGRRPDGCRRLPGVSRRAALSFSPTRDRRRDQVDVEDFGCRGRGPSIPFPPCSATNAVTATPRVRTSAPRAAPPSAWARPRTRR